MPKGVFRKLLVTYMLIVVLIITMVGLLLSQFLKIYFFQEKQDFLVNTGHHVNTLLIKYHRRDMSREELAKGVNIMGQTTNSRIVVIDRPGKGFDRGSIQEKLGIWDKGLDGSLERVFHGETVVLQRQFAEELNTYVVVVGMPATTNKGTRGAIFLFSPVYEVDQALAKVYRIIWLTALLALIVGSGIIFFISGRISRPIIEVSKTAEELAQGIPVGDVSPAGDDEIGQLIKSFNYMKNQLEVTEKMRKELIAAVSHDLRTPLTAIRGFIQGILDGVITPGEQNKYLNLAFQETNRLTRLSNDLLELAKLESGGVKLVKEDVDLGRLVGEVAQSLAGHARAREITLAGNWDMEIRLGADSDRVKQIMWNLLTNAINYTDLGGKVEVEIRENAWWVTVEVRDNGIGIPEEELPFIFDKFHRVDKSRDAALGGTGLGLAIVKNLVELHSGKISIASLQGKGTTVTMELPK